MSIGKISNDALKGSSPFTSHVPMIASISVVTAPAIEII